MKKPPLLPGAFFIHSALILHPGFAPTLGDSFLQGMIPLTSFFESVFFVKIQFSFLCV